LPWVGKDPTKLFAETRAHLSSFSKVRQWLSEGYHQYSKNGQTYVLPDFSGRPEVIIPRGEMAWLLDQPDSVMSAAEFHSDSLAGPYAFTHPKILEDPFHEHVIHRSLARKIGPLIMDVWDELGCAIDDTWGTDTDEWKDICVFENMMHVIARVSNRVFIGLPHCRNKDYLAAMGGFAQNVVSTATLLRFVPKVLEPLMGHVLAMPNYYYGNKASKIVLPLIKERLECIRRKDEDPSIDWQDPNDYLSWHIRVAQAEGNLQELQPEMISRRLLPINFAAIHTTVFTITNCLFDLLSTPASPTADSPSVPVLPMEVIRKEARTEFIANSHEWTKANLSHLVNADSAVRESMRVSNFLTRGLQRKVISKDGIENKKSGWKVPYGTYVGLDVHSIMHDPEIYQSPDSYDPFRFAHARESADEELLNRLNGVASNPKAPAVQDSKISEKHSQNGSAAGLQGQRLNLNATSGTFLPFGHGRHAW
jgi:cytochrome P450